eukprot:s325_g11.t1
MVISKGQVIEAMITGTFTEEADLWAGFLVMDVGLLGGDSTLRARVRSLGCSEPTIMKQLSNQFNRREGFIHLCASEEFCASAGNGDLHITRLRRFRVDAFARDYMTAHIKSQIQKWLKEIGQDGTPAEALEETPPEEEEEDRRPPEESGARAGALRKPATRIKRSAEELGAGDPRAMEEAKRKELRERLTKAKNRMIGSCPPPAGGRAALGVRAEVVEQDTISVGSSSSGYSQSPLPEPLVTGTELEIPRKKTEEKKKRRTSNITAVVPYRRNEESRGEKKKRRVKEKKTVSGDMDTSGGTMNSLQTRLIQKAAEATRHQEQRRKEKSKKEEKKNPGKQLARILTNLSKGHGKKKETSKKKKRRKRKKNQMKPDPDGSPEESSDGDGSSPGDSDYSGSASSSEEESEDKKMEAPLRKRSQRRPGSVLQMLVTHAKNQLDQSAKVEVTAGSAGDATQGVRLTSYFTIIVKPHLGNALAVTREMYHLSNAMDLLRQGELSRLGDVLAGRFMSLHQSVIDGSWSAARHLEVMPMEEVSAAGSAVVLQARRHAKLQAKAQGLESNWVTRLNQKGKGGGRGKSSSWGDGEWSSPSKGKGKGNKGKPKGRASWNAASAEAEGDYAKKKEKPGEK